MDFSYLDDVKYKNIPLLLMSDNNHGGLPFFIRRYSLRERTTNLHRHAYVQINYVSRGGGKHLVKNHEFDIIKGDIFVIPPYIPHCIIGREDSEMEIFEFEFEPGFVSQSFDNAEDTRAFLDFAYIEPFLVSESQIKPRLNLAGKVQVEVENLLREALTEYNDRNPGFILYIKSLLLKLLIVVGREFTRDLKDNASDGVFSRYRDAILGAIQYIGEHFAEDLSVEDVAGRFILSQSYFRYLFKNITSKTFTEYLCALRISKAMELLKTTDKRVLDICLEVGFNNVNHFNRIFRQQTGTTPLMYRKTAGLNPSNCR